MRYLIVIIFVLFLVGCQEVDRGITNFEECVAAGNEIMESYPRQCRNGDDLFVEEVDDMPPGPPGDI